MTLREIQNRRTSTSRQRKKHQHVLDVKVRTSTERRRRVAAICSITFKIVLAVSVVAGAWIGGKEALRRLVWENPEYFIRDVKISTDGTLNREQVLRAGGIVVGSNIFLLSLADARAGIEKLPQVERVEVARTMPNRLAITITERQPIGWLISSPAEDPTASDRSFLIDARGFVMKNRVKLDEYLGFPTISGIPTENLVPGERVTAPEIAAAIELIRLTSADTRFQPRHIDVAKGYCLVVTDHKRATITFDLDDVEEQLRWLRRCKARAAADDREIRTINLIVKNNTPVTFFEPLTALPDPEQSAPARHTDGKSRTSSSAARSTPAGASPALPQGGFVHASKGKITPAPSARKSSEVVKKKPFRLNR